MFPFLQGLCKKVKLGSFALRLVKLSHHVYVNLLLIKKQKQIFFCTLLFIFFNIHTYINFIKVSRYLAKS